MADPTTKLPPSPYGTLRWVQSDSGEMVAEAVHKFSDIEAYGLACYERGLADARAEQSEEIMRCWFVLKEAGRHPGRTDDVLHEVIRRALASTRGRSEQALELSADLKRAKALIVRLWNCHPSARTMIEEATGRWFVWGVDRDAVSQPEQARELSDEEIDAITRATWGEPQGVIVAAYREYARAILAAAQEPKR